MRTNLNKNLEAAFILEEGFIQRNKDRTQKSSNLSTRKHDVNASLLLKQYNRPGLNKTEANDLDTSDQENRINHRTYFFRGIVTEKPRDFRIQSRRKISISSRPVSSLLCEDFFPNTTKAKNDYKGSLSNLSSQKNLDQTTEASSRNFQEKVKNFLGTAQKDTSLERGLQNFDDSIHQYKQNHESNINLSYRKLNLTQEASLDQEMSSLQSLNIKKFLKNKLSGKTKKLDQILSQITIMDKPQTTHIIPEPPKKDEQTTPFASINDIKCPVRRPIKILRPKMDESRMSIKDINDKLKGFTHTVGQQITSYKSLHLYSKISMNNEELRSNIELLENQLPKVKQANPRKRKEEVKKIFIQEIFRVVKKMKLLNLNIEDIATLKVFSHKAFEKPNSTEFFKAVKSGDYEAVSDLLFFNKYLVYDFDGANKTALHWAVERNRSKITKLLLENGADFDAKDMIGRTPLFLAAKHGHVICTKLLLMYKANPLIRSDGKKIALDYASNFEIKRLLEIAGKIHAVMSGFTWKKFQKMWDYLDKRDFEIKERHLI